MTDDTYLWYQAVPIAPGWVVLQKVSLWRPDQTTGGIEMKFFEKGRS